MRDATPLRFRPHDPASRPGMRPGVPVAIHLSLTIGEQIRWRHLDRACLREQLSMDEFEDVALNARLPAMPVLDGNANTRRRMAIARVVSRVYRAANDSMRADMLKHLLRPLGILGLVAVASGAFARHAQRGGMVPDTISAEELLRYSSEQVRDLTLFVHEVNPDALQPLVEQLSQNAMGMAALSTAALVMLLRRSRRRSARPIATVSPDLPATPDAAQLNQQSPMSQDRSIEFSRAGEPSCPDPAQPGAERT